MKTNRINAQFLYRQTGKAKPVKEGMVHGAQSRTIRVYLCIDCRQGGGTLQNTGTHQKPVYIHPACKKRRELLAQRRRIENA